MTTQAGKEKMVVISCLDICTIRVQKGEYEENGVSGIGNREWRQRSR